MISSLMTSWRIPPPFPRTWSLAPPMPLPFSSTPSPRQCPSRGTMPRVSLRIPHHAFQHHRWVAATCRGKSVYGIHAVWLFGCLIFEQCITSWTCVNSLSSLRVEYIYNVMNTFFWPSPLLSFPPFPFSLSTVCPPSIFAVSRHLLPLGLPLTIELEVVSTSVQQIVSL